MVRKTGCEYPCDRRRPSHPETHLAEIERELGLARADHAGLLPGRSAGEALNAV